ncbi:F-box-like domain-containing protein [Legionella spiritensis]|uniref:F-box-like protein n=1 Tax=Legionella spiritensis TaxID=452 RepID=A0A0W0Z9G4_LEGSP|nr:F-box-like domain-containing protein [Legionella spiritensis]KTD65762.1 F-box-like protein [Legionella spiritensis]SNV42667.1 F-box-like [Legionella spiritensis]
MPRKLFSYFRRSYFRQSDIRNDIYVDPVNFLHSAIVFSIFSYLSHQELASLSLVSKRWYEQVEAYYHQDLCLNKGDESSWKVYFNKKNRLAHFMAPSRQLKEIHSNLIGGSVLIDQSQGKACFAYSEKGRDHSIKFEIWDLEKDSCIKTISCLEKERMYAIAFSYPYLVTKSEDTIYIRDVTKKEVKSTVVCKIGPHPINRFKDVFSLEARDFGCQFGYISDRIFDKTSARVATFSKDNPKKVNTNLFGDEQGRVPSDAVSLLHKNLFIYTILPGILHVVDVFNLESSPVELVVPEVSRFVESVDKKSKKEMAKLGERNSFVALIANDNVLVAQTKQNILVWDLKSGELQRIFPLAIKFPILDRTYNLLYRVNGICALSGDILFAHDSEQGVAQAFDLGNNGKTLKTWKFDQEHSRHPVGCYKGKVYMINSPEEKRTTLTMFNFFNRNPSKDEKPLMSQSLDQLAKPI